MRSMTGFGKGEAVLAHDGKLTVELGAVNRKQLEIRVVLPRVLNEFDCDVRKYIQSCLSRGALNVSVHLQQSAGTDDTCIDEHLLLTIARSVRKVQLALGQGEHVDVAALAGLPGVMMDASVEESELESLKEALFTALEQAMERFLAMRSIEGEALAVELAERRRFLEELLEQIDPLTAEVSATIKKKLLEKLEKERIVTAPDDERLLKEMLFYADKADVSEELTRLRSHFSQFDMFLNEKSQPVGRSIDFLIQEMFREINTLGNKCSLPQVSARVIRFKSELEKLREQIQNIE